MTVACPLPISDNRRARATGGFMKRFTHLAITLMTVAACGGRGADGEAPAAPPSEPAAAPAAPSEPAAPAPQAPAAEPQTAPSAEPQASPIEPAAPADKSATTRAPASDPARTPVAQQPAAAREAAAAQPAPAAAAAPCGEKGQPSCPLQAWMEKNLQKPLDDGDLEAVALGLGRVPKLVPDPSWNAGGDGWSAIAESGAAAAKRGDIDATKQSCKSCHKTWRRKYKEGFRHRPI
jgi:hypothetical protein